MEFKLRKVSDFADVTLIYGGVTIELGFLDNKEARQLLDAFRDAVEELEWFVNATDKNEPPPSQ